MGVQRCLSKFCRKKTIPVKVKPFGKRTSVRPILLQYGDELNTNNTVITSSDAVYIYIYLFERMINQGAAASKLFKQIDKVVKRHPDAFTSFNQNVNTIKSDIEEHSR